MNLKDHLAFVPVLSGFIALNSSGIVLFLSAVGTLVSIWAQIYDRVVSARKPLVGEAGQGPEDLPSADALSNHITVSISREKWESIPQSARDILSGFIKSSV